MQKPTRPTTPAKQQDAFAVLGLPQTATQDQINAALRRLAMQYHPDRQPPQHRAAAQRQFQMILDAYAKIKNPVVRAQYQANLKNSNDNQKDAWSVTWRSLRAIFWPFEKL